MPIGTYLNVVFSRFFLKCLSFDGDFLLSFNSFQSSHVRLWVNLSIFDRFPYIFEDAYTCVHVLNFIPTFLFVCSRDMKMEEGERNKFFLRKFKQIIS